METAEVGMREFREKLAGDLESGTPLAIMLAADPAATAVLCALAPLPPPDCGWCAVGL